MRELVAHRLSDIELPRPVSPATIMRMLYALGSTHDWRVTYPETAAGIAEAAGQDPLLTNESGAEITASLLVAVAFEASRLDPYSHGGGRVGLFRIRPPTYPRPEPNVLLLPRSAALVAIDLMRTSFSTCVRMPWEKRLAWFFDLGTPNTAPSGSALRRSSEVMRHGKQIFLRYFKPKFAAEAVMLQLGDGNIVEERGEDLRPAFAGAGRGREATSDGGRADAQASVPEYRAAALSSGKYLRRAS
jgi:hypothetical protein